MGKPWIVLGGGGHACVVTDLLQVSAQEILGFTTPEAPKEALLGYPCLGTDEALKAFGVDEVHLAMGVGSVRASTHRQQLFERLCQSGYVFPPLVHPRATIATAVVLEPGVQVMAGAVLQPRCKIQENVIINTRATVDHDCIIGAHAHLAPGATLSGGVVVGQGAHIGTGACILQGITIGAKATVGAGAVVIRDVAPGQVVIGVPASARNT